eukprot:TRINITY_DN55605_c0_g1_i1.p1 TRINITY_DN55605_c0_g1~~TRINITY_DN55605_c0_g1_i1.p1  ORF type:complete len:350 (+),score=88.34 TRINITY_DN55605_c0_g1_i1:56-1051(+)
MRRRCPRPRRARAPPLGRPARGAARLALPRVDVGPFAAEPDGDSAAHRRCAEALREACTAWGFFVMTGHGAPRRVLDAALSESAAFFALPQGDKDQVRMRHFRGYQGLGENVTQGRRDPHEALDYFHDPCPACAGTPLALALNPWPPRPAGLRGALLQYVGAMLRTGHAVMGAVAMSLGVPRAAVDEWTADPFWVLRAIHYPQRAAVPQAEDWGAGCGVHTDYGFLTFVVADDTPGALSVMAVDGTWHTVDPPDGDGICVNIGDMLSSMTGGTYRSTPHQVSCVAGRSRLSVPFFFEPSFDAVLRPVVGDSSTAPVKYGDHLLKKLTTNFG